MQPDLNRYRPFLDGYDWPEEQKTEALTELWKIMSSFVDRAFGQAPEQQLKLGGFGNQRKSQGASAAKQLESLASESPSALDCEDPLEPTFNDAADKGSARKRPK